MCETCGCGLPGEKATIRVPGEDMKNHEGGHQIHDHEHPQNHDHHSDHYHHNRTDHGHEHKHSYSTKRISVETDILNANNLMAERNRGIFEAKNLTVINIMSSPGSGKTTLLERTIKDLKEVMNIAVIEGDQQTMNDSERISATGVSVVQINTGSGCHLDAEMINRAVKRVSPADGSIIIIENVGNLVCPALFDLGEAARVVIMSVTEGEDKPLKYPNMFRNTDLCLLNKIDLIPYLDYDISKAEEYLHQVNPHLGYVRLSSKTGEGMDKWYEWLKKLDKGVKS